MRECYREKRFSEESQTLIAQCNVVIEDFQQQGYTLTLRQLYYQLVSKNVIPNVEKSYKRLSGIVSDARLAGLMDWDAIEDRGRSPRGVHFYGDRAEFVSTLEYAAAGFTLDHWRGQRHYVELWVEKDALASVLTPLASKHHVTLMVNKGYSSQSAMYASAGRFIEKQGDLSPVLLYLGDHDPSGEDMVRDIRDRLSMFGVEDLDVEKIALTMEQVKKYNPPPNPAKLTDPRAEAYVAEHGNSSWEVDALSPRVLNSIITAAITGYVDSEELDKVLADEKKERAFLTKELKKLRA